MAQSDFRSVLNIVPAGRSLFPVRAKIRRPCVDQPAESIESIVHGMLNLLEAVRFIGHPIRIYNASSSDASARWYPASRLSNKRHSAHTGPTGWPRLRPIGWLQIIERLMALLLQWYFVQSRIALRPAFVTAK